MTLSFKEGYRDTLAFILSIYPERGALTVKEVADMLGSSIDAIYDAIHRRKNPLPHKVVGSKKIIIPVPALARWMC